MAINMPSINIYFKQLAATAIQRSALGRLVVICRDDTVAGEPVLKCTSLIDLAAVREHYTEDNYNMLSQAFTGGPNLVYIVKQKTEETFANNVVPLLRNIKFDWITALTDDIEYFTELIAYVQAENKKPQRKKKALVYKATAPNDMRIINFVTESYNTISAQNQPGWKLLGRIAGVAAGLPMTRSLTYYNFPEIESVVEPEDLDAEVEEGHLFLFNDDDGVKLSRGVNSLTEIDADHTEDMRSIAIVEAMDLMDGDLRTAWKEYVGRYKNKYDYQCLYISAANGYFTELEKDDILDSNYANSVDVDIESQRDAWLAVGKTEAADWDDITVKLNTFKRSVFLLADTKILDAMEDLTFRINMM